ncbi:hypothetical protein HK102_012200, partial [Quaeritorhiza haematococci]
APGHGPPVARQYIQQRAARGPGGQADGRRGAHGRDVEPPQVHAPVELHRRPQARRDPAGRPLSRARVRLAAAPAPRVQGQDDVKERQQLLMLKLAHPGRPEGEQARPRRRRRGPELQAVVEEEHPGRVVEDGRRHHPDPERRLRREAGQPPRPVERSVAHHRVRERQDVRDRVEERRVPQPGVARVARRPEPAVLQQVVEQSAVHQIRLDAAKPREQHRMVDRKDPREAHRRHEPRAGESGRPVGPPLRGPGIAASVKSTHEDVLARDSQESQLASIDLRPVSFQCPRGRVRVASIPGFR